MGEKKGKKKEKKKTWGHVLFDKQSSSYWAPEFTRLLVGSLIDNQEKIEIGKNHEDYMPKLETYSSHWVCPILQPSR